MGTGGMLVLGRFGRFQLERYSEGSVEYILVEKGFLRSVSPLGERMRELIRDNKYSDGPINGCV